MMTKKHMDRRFAAPAAPAAGPVDGGQRARLIGCINPVGMKPSFLIPVFEVEGRLVLQEAGEDERIRDFYSYDGTELGELERLDLDTYAQVGGEVLYGFVFPDGERTVKPRTALARTLCERRAELAKYQFLYMEVLEFLGLHEELEQALGQVERAYADNRLLGRNWVSNERRFLAEKLRIGS